MGVRCGEANTHGVTLDDLASHMAPPIQGLVNGSILCVCSAMRAHRGCAAAAASASHTQRHSPRRARRPPGWHALSTRSCTVTRNMAVRPVSVGLPNRARPRGGTRSEGAVARFFPTCFKGIGRCYARNWCGLPAAAPAGKTALVGGLPVRTRRAAPQRRLTRPCLPLGRPAPKASPHPP